MSVLLPVDLFGVLLNDWLITEEIPVLDTACSNYAIRSVFLEALHRKDCSPPDYLNCFESYFKWIFIRNIKLKRVEFYHKNFTPIGLKINIDLSDIESICLYTGLEDIIHDENEDEVKLDNPDAEKIQNDVIIQLLNICPKLHKLVIHDLSLMDIQLIFPSVRQDII